MNAATLRVNTQALLKRALARPAAVLDALRTRDRLCLLAALAALGVGLELGVIAPLHDKRRLIEAALAGGEAERQQALELRHQQAQQREDDLQRRSDKVAAALAAGGASAAPRESLRFLLSRTLQGLSVQVLSLRAMSSDEIAVDAPARADAPPGAASATLAPLYRHRYELRVGGALPELLVVVDALERQARPLRVERVQLQADAQGAIEACITLIALGPERTWLTL